MQIVSACLARDLPVYRVTVKSLRAHLPGAEIHVVTRKEDFLKFRQACGSEIHLWDESELVPNMTLAALREMPFPFFPKGAGWYFQQFLKYAFEQVSNQDEYFLIWDADTILLRPLEFFTPEGLPIYTRASEHHLPYFETFQSLFGEKADREFSFISQHQIINKAILREMMKEIESRRPACGNWAWAIIDGLKGEGSNLFSEYETYGHYMKLRHPGTFVLRDLSWTRNGGGSMGFRPRAWHLGRLAKRWDFAAFEASDRPLRSMARRLRGKLAR